MPSLVSSVVTAPQKLMLCSCYGDHSGLRNAPAQRIPSEVPRASGNGSARHSARVDPGAYGAGSRVLAAVTGGLMLAAEGGPWWNVSRY